MKYIFLDTETTGLPQDYDAPFTDIDNWPRLVQLGWIIYDNREVLKEKENVIKPIGFAIPQQATNVHGISMADALERGLRIEIVLNEFLDDVSDADAFIGHNIAFDVKVLQSEFYRLSIDNKIDEIETLDTMLLSTNFCRIPSQQYGYRYPKLIELYNKLFSESFDNMHDAMADIKATAKCFWAMVDRGIIDKEEYPCLLSEQERKELAEKYNKQAIEIVWGTRSGDAEELYLKSAKLGNTESMYKVALYNMGGITSHRKDYDTALYWLEKIVSISKTQKVSWFWYEPTLKDLIKIYKEFGNRSKVSLYQQMLEEETNKQANDLEGKANNSESDYCKLVSSLYYGTNGVTKDRNRAYSMMEKGISKGYRSLYGMYSEYLREKGDEKYFQFLLEDIKDTQKELEREKSFMRWSHNERTSSWMYRTHKDYWLTKKYRLVAEAYLNGFGVNQDIEKAIKYLWEALNCNSQDRETIYLLAKIYNGEFGIQYINFDTSISKLESLPLKYMDNKYPYALLGDAYIGKSLGNFFKAGDCYEKYNDISNYKSELRKKYCKYRNIISFLLLGTLVAAVTLVFVL